MRRNIFYCRIGKPLLDRILAALSLLLFAPLLAGAALVVRLFVGTPVLFRQTRPGLHRRPFDLLKFRTMNDACDPDGQLKSDAERLTSLGSCLRSTSIDELPELWNVLKGDMSLVGPRPLLVEYLPRYSEEQARRHEVKPGITGWAQVHGRNGLGWEEKFEFDVWYVDHLSFKLDLKILALTVRRVFARDGISAHDHATMPKFTGCGHAPTAALPTSRKFPARKWAASPDTLNAPSRVSVIIPTLNRADMLRRALNSVFAQTAAAFEVIVVDDGSRDHTPEVIGLFDDPRLVYLRHDTTRGASAARNTALRICRGDYVAFLDSDDEWLPAKLDRQLDTFARCSPRTGLVYTGVEYVLPNRNSRMIRPRFRGRIIRSLLVENVVGSTSVGMVRREVFDVVGGFDESLGARQDADLWLRIANLYDVDFVPEILVRFHVHAGLDRISDDVNGKLTAREVFYAKHSGPIEAEGVAYKYHAKTARIALRRARDRRASRRYSRLAIQANRLRPLGYMAYAASFIPEFVFTGRLGASDAARRLMCVARRMGHGMLGRA